MTTRSQKQNQKPAQKSSKARGSERTAAPAGVTQTIALNLLSLSPLNVRKTGGQKIEDLAASITAVDLIHNLTVIRSEGKKERYEVICGGRRLAALQRLVKDKTIKADHPVRCRVVDADKATEASLAENIIREAMHPADQFEAFRQLVDGGKSQVEIAADFAVPPSVVRDRLALARVAPEVLALYRTSGLTLDQVMAFTVTTDHDQQRAVLANKHVPSAWDIKRQLLAGAVSSKDTRAMFVGKKAYEAAGGKVRKDLFAGAHDDGSFYEDGALLERLAVAKLEVEAEPLRTTWAWVEARTTLDYTERSRFGSVPLITLAATDEQAARIAVLEAGCKAASDALDAYETDHAEDDEDEAGWSALDAAADTARDALETALAELERPDPEATAYAGAIVTLTNGGKVQIYTGLVRPEDKARLASSAKQTGGRAAANAADTGPSDPLPVRLGLSALRTAVAQEAIAENIEVALRMLAFGLVQSTLRVGHGVDMYGLNVRGSDKANLSGACEGLDALPVGQRNAERAAAWAADLPTDDAALWTWCLAADDHTIRSLLAYCTARTLDGVQRFPASRDEIGPVAQALGIDMADHWQPTTAYFAKVKKADTLAAVTEAAGGVALPELTKLKREQLAEEATKRLAGTRWLPPTLRTAA